MLNFYFDFTVLDNLYFFNLSLRTVLIASDCIVFSQFLIPFQFLDNKQWNYITGQVKKKRNSSGLTKKGNCRICNEAKIDSLLYRYLLAFKAKYFFIISKFCWLLLILFDMMISHLTGVDTCAPVSSVLMSCNGTVENAQSVGLRLQML